MSKINTQQTGIPGMVGDAELLGLLRPYLRHCGDDSRQPWIIETRCLLDYLLVYIASGTGRFDIAGKTYNARANDLFWIPPRTPHRMEGFAPHMECVYAHFDLIYRREVSHWDFSIPGGMTDLSELNTLTHPPMNVPSLTDLAGQIRTHTNRQVGNELRELCVEAARSQPHSALRTSGMLTTIIADILRGKRGGQHADSQHLPRLEEAAEFLRNNCRRDISVEEAAELCELSPSHFRKLFAAYFGCSPRDYLRQARIGMARRMMTASAMTLSEIATECGFANVHSFSRAFKATEGVSPSEYRSCGPATVRTNLRKVGYAH